MSRRRIVINGILVAAFALLCVVGMEFLAVNIGQPNPLSNDYTVNAAFANADGIPTAADVSVAGVVVGKVSSVSHDPAHPDVTVVTMHITDSRAVPVYSNGFAKVRPKTLLGEKYVDLTVGDHRGEAIQSGGMLPETQTGKVVENDEIFNAFDAKTREQQRQVLQELNAATQDRAGDIQAILPQLQGVVQNLTPVAQVYEQDNPEVDHIFTQLNTVMGTLADEQQQLAGLLANGNSVLGAVAQRDQSLVRTLQGASDVATEFNTAMAPTVSAQRASLQRLAPTLDQLNQFLNLIIEPQASCGGRVCGVEELFTGTLLGNINYPNDQLTITTPEGEQVTNLWASMFSVPTDAYHSGGKTHAAQSIVLSVHCDELGATLGSTLGANPTLAKLLQTACNGATGHPVAAGGSNAPASTAVPGGVQATESAWLTGGVS